MRIKVDYIESKETLHKIGNKLFTEEQIKELREED